MFALWLTKLRCLGELEDPKPFPMRPREALTLQKLAAAMKSKWPEGLFLLLTCSSNVAATEVIYCKHESSDTVKLTMPAIQAF
jgi:hypothetical protein